MYKEEDVFFSENIINAMAEKIIAETSARHVHLTAEHVEILFGKGHTLTHKKDLSQPGQFACEERVTVEGPKSALKNVIVLGPTRPATQVELSLTDARSIGITAPIKESGDIAGSASVKLIGPEGEVVIKEGAIAAKRHLHLTPECAAANGVCDKEIVMVKLDSARPLIFDDVVCRVSEKFSPAFHMDTDESNAAAAAGVVYCEIIKK